MPLTFDDFRFSYVQEHPEPQAAMLTAVWGSELHQRLKNAFDSSSPFLYQGQSFWVMTMRPYEKERSNARMVDCDLRRIVPRTHCFVDKVDSAPQPPPVDSGTFKLTVPLTPAQQAVQRAMMQPQQKRVGLLGLDSVHD